MKSKFSCRMPAPRVSAIAVAVHLAFSTAVFGSAMLGAQSAHAQAGPEKAYSIPAGALGPALSSFAAQAGVLLSFDPALAQGKATQGLSGNYSVNGGFSKLLSGTGLNARSSDGKNFTLERSSGAAILPDVVVTSGSDGSAAQGYLARNTSVAGFTEQSVLDTPFSTKVMPSELLVNQMVDDVRKLDQLDASVTASAMVPGYVSTTHIRGFILNGYSNYRYNGMPIIGNSALHGLENKERVEILKGLSALQAGFASPGGLLNYVSKRPTAGPLNDLHLSANQYGNAKVHADLSRRSESGDFGIRMNAAWEELRSFVDGADGDRQFLSLAADWKISPDTILQLDAEYHKREQKFQPALAVDSNGNVPKNVDPKKYLGQDWTYYPSETRYFGAKLEHAVSNQWSLLADASYGSSRFDYRNPFLTAVQPNGDATLGYYYSPNNENNAANLRVMARGRFDTGAIQHELVFGYSYLDRENYVAKGSFWGLVGATNIHRPVRLTDPTPSVDMSQYRSSHTSEQAFFFNDIVSLSEAWKMHLGGRYAKRNDRGYDVTGAETSRYDKSVFAPSAALVFKPQQNISTYVSYIEGLENGGTAPLVNGAGVPLSNAREVMPPLTSKQIEMGVKAEVNASLMLEAAIFQIKQPAEFISGTTYVQSGSREHRGLELSATGKLAKEWTAFASAMLLDAEFKETGDPAVKGKRPSGVPEHRFVSILEYAPSALPGWAFSGNWTYTGSKPTDDANVNEFVSAYSIFALGARYNTRVGSVPATIRLYIDNLFDKDYYANSVWGELVQGAPRTATVSASFRF